MHTKMDRNTKSLGIALVAASALAFGAIGCSASDDDDRCDTSTVMFFSTVDRHYHYGSPTGKVVPANKVPSSARKVPGYSAPKPAAKPKADTPKVNKPAAPRPAAGGRKR